ncbi:hypothetical protein Tco_0781020 [Tanacetum coccineum]
MTPLHLVTTAEAMAEATTPRKRSDVCYFGWVQVMLYTWGVEEGLPHRLEVGESATIAYTHLIIAQHVADAMTTYEANRNSGNGINNKTSGSAGGVEHWNG